MSDRNQEMREMLAEHLRLQNLRNTPERSAVLDAVLQTDGPFTPETLQEIMESRQNFRVCRATVYNGLGLLEDAGLVRKICLSGLVRYEKCWKNRSTIRLTCTSCGSVTDVTDDGVRRQIESMRKRRFTMAGWSLTVYGLCSKCSAAIKRKQNRLNKKDKDKK